MSPYNHPTSTARDPRASMADDARVNAALHRAAAIQSDLCSRIDGLGINADLRSRMAGGCFWIVLDLHAAIASLVDRGCIASAFVLVRPIWEALIKGLWLLECADQPALKRFHHNQGSPSLARMIQQLERVDGFAVGVLSMAHAQNIGRMHSMTHIGGPLAVRCNSSDMIGSNFDPDEIVECLGHAAAVTMLAALGMAKLADDGGLATQLLDLAKRHLAA